MGCFKLKHIDKGHLKKIIFSPKDAVNKKGNAIFFRLNTSPYGFQGQESDDEVKGEGNSVNYKYRMLDPRLGRWMSRDPIAGSYPSMSPYCYVGNMPTIAIDPDGKRIYFIGGAGNDNSGWNYISRWINIFSKNFMEVKRLNASHGSSGDMIFSSSKRDKAWDTEVEYASQATGQDVTNPNNTIIKKRVALTDATIQKAVDEIMADLDANPLGDGETLDLMGYSYGSVAQAHIALALADRGIKVDNLVLVGSPISDNSNLMNALLSNENIVNVLRYDIPGDEFSNPSSSIDMMQGMVQSSSDSSPHFDLARPGKKADDHINALARSLRHLGVGRPAKGSTNDIFYDTATKVEKTDAVSGVEVENKSRPKF